MHVTLPLSVNNTKLLSLFFAETERTLADMESCWQALQAGVRQPDIRRTLSRAANTIADNASMLGLHNLASPARVVERISDGMFAQGDRISACMLVDLRGRLDDLGRQFGSVRAGLEDAISNQDAVRRYHA